MDRNALKEEYIRLANDLNFPEKADKRRRGIDFEKLIRKLLDKENLDPNSSFRPDGEEIDGSFIYNNKVFLFEAKWHASPMPASSIYQFKGKVDGKLVGTIGIYISMSGFSTEAVDALTYGKSVNIILFDRKDFEICITENNGFSKVLDKKLRIATEKGTPFFSMSFINLESNSPNIQSPVKVLRRTKINFKRNAETIPSHFEIFIIVEGQGDQEMVAYLAQKILELENKKSKINITNSGGKYSTAQLANAINDFSDNDIKTILIADSDYDIDETYNMLYRNLEVKNATIIIPDPDIETWFQQSKIYDRNDMLNMARDRKLPASKIRQHLLGKIDIAELRKSCVSFEQFYNALIIN